MVLRVSYVGTQGHHLLALHDENAGNIQTCLGLINLSNATLSGNNVLAGPGGTPTTCGRFSGDTEYFIPGGTVIPAAGTTLPNGTVVPPGGISALPPEPFHVPSISCTG